MTLRLAPLLTWTALLIGTAGAAGGERLEPGPAPRTDSHGDLLPAGAVLRLGALRLQHGGPISSLLFTRDGRGVITAGGEAVLRLWDVSTGKEIRHFEGHQGPVVSMALSPDGTTLASGAEDETIRLWNVATGRPLRNWAVPEGARLQVAFSPDGRLLASGGKDNAVVLWDVSSGKEVRQLKPREQLPERHRGPVAQTLLSLAFTPDGRHLLVAQPEGLFLRELPSGKCLRQYESPFAGGWACGNGTRTVTAADICKGFTFSADGQAFLTPSGMQGPIRICELNSVEERGRLAGHDNVVLAAHFAPDGKTVVSAGMDGTLRTWDAATLKETLKIATGLDLITDLAVSPDAKTVAVGSVHGRVLLWDLTTGKERTVGERLEPAVALGFGLDGRAVLALDGHLLRRWDTRTGKQLTRVAVGEEKEAALWCLSADRRRLAQARPGQPIRLLDALTGKEARTLEGKYDQILKLALSDDGKLLAAATVEGDPIQGMTCTVRLWDALTGKELRPLTERAAPPTSLAITPDGRAVLVGDASGGFRLWEVATGKERRRLGAPSRNRLAAEQAAEMGMMMMRMRAMQAMGEAEHAAAPVFTADGRELAADDGTIIRVWSLTGSEVVRRFACEDRPPGAFAFSADGRLLAAGGPDGAVWIWNNATTRLLGRLQGHRGPVLRLAFSADGESLISSSEDGTALVWDVDRALAAAAAAAPCAGPTGEELAVLWADLGDADAARAYDAIQKLAQAPQPAVRLLRRHLHPVATVDGRQVARLIAELDDPQFQVRHKATQQLAQLHDRVAGELARALAAKPPPEQRRRLEELLQRVRRHQLPADSVRTLRAVEVLEMIATPQARQQLEDLAHGVPDARLTREARAALDRLTQRQATGTRRAGDEAVAAPR